MVLRLFAVAGALPELAGNLVRVNVLGCSPKCRLSPNLSSTYSLLGTGTPLIDEPFDDMS
jgi:hypothetical protein